MSAITTKSPKKSLEFFNEVMDKKALNKLFSQIYLDYGTSKTSFLADQLKNLGFKYATKAGTTISIDDLTVPDEKKDLINQAEDEIERATYRYLKGEITEVERYTKVIDTWSETTEKLTKSVVDNFKRTNPVYMMAFSGARGNISQVSQLVGMRGLMADAQGQIIDLPIKSNFKEGLSVTEYIISSYGARKGLVDTALKTADSGYLTRRLVDVAQDVIIRIEDCNTEKFIEIEAIKDATKEYVSLTDRLLGRTVQEDILDTDEKVVISKNTTLSNDDIKRISGIHLKKIKIRSPLTCECDYGICQKCYGWALTKNNVVDIGEAIGIIAAQSIGEPGTQLTMRTFHTGGVFRGSASMFKIKAQQSGKIKSMVATKDLRTRHGDEVQVSSRDGKIEIEDSKGKIHSYNVPYGATIFHNIGTEIKSGQAIAEYEPGSGVDGSSRLTEKATKDITTDVGGQIFFDGFSVDEKRDRQGNISRTANRNGKIWVLAGDVYNLPGSSEIIVNDGQLVKKGEVLAETITVSEHGGEVRLSGELELEEITKNDKKINKIVNGKEITIVIASITPGNAVLESTKKEQIWKVQGYDETYVIKSPIDTLVENGATIAELIDEENHVTSSGEIRYAGVETDENQIVITPGKVVFIPEEIHQVSKDSSLKMVESGTFVEAGTEVVKDVRTHIDGVIEIKEYNDIVHEVIVRPGELIKLEDASALKVEDGEIVEAGTEIAKGVKAKTKSIVSVISGMVPEAGVLDITDEDVDVELEDDLEPSLKSIEVLIRPVQEYEIVPRDVNIKFNTTEELIDVVPVTQLQYRDGARIRHLEGANLTRVSLVLQMEGYLSRLKGLVELSTEKNNEQNLKIVVLESLIVRRETESASREKASLQTELLVKAGQIIEPKTPVSKTQVLARNEAKVSLGSTEKEDLRRLLLISPDAKETIKLKSKPVVTEGELISLDQPVSKDGEQTHIAGKVLEVKTNEIIIHKARPYLISSGAQLQVSNDGLVQRGDFLATLVFERQKTGDIVQGLPRVEELLEGRKPKESAILAEDYGEAIIEFEEDSARLFLQTETGKYEVKVPIDSNIIVTDKQKIIKGQPLTSGPLNPHDVIRLSGVEAVQQYLLDEVQRVYRSQGVEIADKHVEVIVRQMSKKVKVDDAGDTKLLPGELTEQSTVEAENKAIEKLGGIAAVSHPVLLGITKASLNTESFISAASFQETTRVLTEAAVEGKKDQLRGLKENVIIGRLIPAGTGYYHLTHSSEDQEEEERKRRSRNTARKPSAILEEIEGLFGAPDFSVEQAMGAVLQEEAGAIDSSDESENDLYSSPEEIGVDDDELVGQPENEDAENEDDF